MSGGAPVRSGGEHGARSAPEGLAPTPDGRRPEGLAPAPDGRRAAGPDRYRDGYVLTDDPARVDLDRVHRWVSVESYWATGRERAVVERSVAGARPYSVHAVGGPQVACARVVTDGATFAWVCDVFVDAEHRGRGLGGWLVDSIVEDLAALGVRRILLMTLDAHEVYRRSGFTELEPAGRYMAITPD